MSLRVDYFDNCTQKDLNKPVIIAENELETKEED